MLDAVESVQDHCRVIVDSGAFTAHNAGKEITLDGYCQWLDSLPFKPWKYFSLDVYGDPEGTASNYREMLDRGYQPVPVFTTGETLDDLDGYYQHSDYVGIGGTLLAKNKAGYFKWIHDHNKGRKAHFLGQTSLPLIKSLKPYTCDSSTWETGAMYGVVPYVRADGVVEKLNCKNAVGISPKAQNEIKQFGYSMADLYDPEQWKGTHAVHRNLGAASWVRASQTFEKMIGTRVFLATTTPQGLNMLFRWYRDLYL